MASFGTEMDGEGGLVELAADAAVEIGVIGGGDVGLRLGPEGGAVGDLGRLRAGLLHDRDGHRHVAGLRLDDPLQGEALGVGLGVLHEVKDHAGPARRRVRKRRRRHREGAFAVRRPQPRLVGAGPAGDHVDPVRHHEDGIEADAELADERRAVAALCGFDPLQEGPGAGTGDGAERLHHFIAAHADAVVLDGEATVFGVDGERDARLRIVAQQRRGGDRLVAQLFVGVRGVRNQLAEKDGLVRIDGVHHQVQELGDIGLEHAAFGAGLIS